MVTRQPSKLNLRVRPPSTGPKMAKRSVHRPVENVQMNVRNQSKRSLAISLIVLHDTESHDIPGTTDLAGIGSWFDNPAAQASAHICVDGQGFTGRYVPDSEKAWHVGNFNSASLGIEQVGQASMSKGTWLKRINQQRTVAKWIAYWSKTYNIPIQRATLVSGVVRKPGIATHADCSQHGAGTDHTDPGPNYPVGTVLGLARFYRRFGWR